MIYTIVSIFALLIVNLIHTHILADKKYSNYTVILVLLGFTVLLFTPVFWVGIVEGTTIRSVLLGLLYIIPLYYLYDMSFKKIFIVMLYCWTYTSGINVIGLGIAGIFASESTLIMFAFYIQVVLIIITFPFIIKYTLNKFKIILSNLNKRNLDLLVILAFFIFAALTIIRFYFDVYKYAFLVLSIIVGAIAFNSYHLFFNITEANIKLKKAYRMVSIDTLTGIYNRYALLSEMNSKIDKEEEFSILFMDLDKLKSINDNYSHDFGDKYLIKFANSLKESIGNNGKVYRFAGDEFICMISNSKKDIDINDIKNKIHHLMNEEFDFNGVSIGQATYPENGGTVKEIISKADKSMYIDKHSNRSNNQRVSVEDISST